MKIGIVGAGISGLVTAYYLHRNHSITVFDAKDYVGGHTNTVDIETGDCTYSIDTGFIVFNDWTYPRFIELLEQLGVESQPTEMSFSVKDPKSGLEYNGHSIDSLFAQRVNFFKPRFHRMVWDIVRFNRQSKRVSRDLSDDLTVAEYLSVNKYGREFRNWYLYPMGSAIWSCPTGQFASFPIRFVIDFFNNHGLLNLRDRPQWRVIRGGSRSYVPKLIAGFKDHIRLNSPVTKMLRTESSIELFVGHREPEVFDHVVFACHADQALQILGEASTSAERELLSTFPYSKNVAVLHTDINMLPRSRRACASWNYRLSEDSARPASVTYNMNILQGIDSDETFCVTLNGESEINPTKVLKSFVYEHPVFTIKRSAAQRRRFELIDSNRVSFCGAYWGNGFHEDGVVSALDVVGKIQNVSRNTTPIGLRANRPVPQLLKERV